MSKQGTWLEQWDRVQRYYKRLKKINDGISPPDNKAHIINFSDEVYTFFVHCYHMKDWIYYDRNVKFCDKGKILSDYIKNNDCLMLCEDICNSVKHLNLKTERSKAKKFKGFKEDSMVTREFKDGKLASTKAAIDVLVEGKEKDAFKLATECIEKWQGFIKQYIEEKN